MEPLGLLACPHHSHPNLHFSFWTARQLQIHTVQFWNISKNYFEIKSQTLVKSGRTNAFTNIFNISIGMKEGRGRNTWVLNPLGTKKAVMCFCSACPACLVISYAAITLPFQQGMALGHRMMGMIFIWHRVREKWEYGDKKEKWRHCGRCRSMRESWTLSRRGQRNTTQIQSKSLHSGSVWNTLFKNQSISGCCHLCALLGCQLWLLSTPTDHVLTFSTVVKASGKKAAYPVRVCSNAGGLVTECFFINKFLILDTEF